VATHVAIDRISTDRITVAGQSWCIGYLSQITTEHPTMLLFKPMVEQPKTSTDKRFCVMNAETGEAARSGWKETAVNRNTRKLNHQQLVRPR
jgi:hypothetical protein